ncbi:MAG: hypothetical protein ACRCWP_01775, partial [Shewanella sp.]
LTTAKMTNEYADFDCYRNDFYTNSIRPKKMPFTLSLNGIVYPDAFIGCDVIYLYATLQSALVNNRLSGYNLIK